VTGFLVAKLYHDEDGISLFEKTQGIKEFIQQMIDSKTTISRHDKAILRIRL
jgi:hypothetical protein